MEDKKERGKERREEDITFLSSKLHNNNNNSNKQLKNICLMLTICEILCSVSNCPTHTGLQFLVYDSKIQKL